jgi:transposase-like protein
LSSINNCCDKAFEPSPQSFKRIDRCCSRPQNWTVIHASKRVQKGDSTNETTRTFNPEFKACVVLHLLTATKSAAQPCREHSLSNPSLSKQFIDNASAAFAPPPLRAEGRSRPRTSRRAAGNLAQGLVLTWRWGRGRERCNTARHRFIIRIQAYNMPQQYGRRACSKCPYGGSWRIGAE